MDIYDWTQEPRAYIAYGVYGVDVEPGRILDRTFFESGILDAWGGGRCHYDIFVRRDTDEELGPWHVVQPHDKIEAICTDREGHRAARRAEIKERERRYKKNTPLWEQFVNWFDWLWS